MSAQVQVAFKVSEGGLRNAALHPGSSRDIDLLETDQKKTKRQRAPVILWWRWRRSRLEGLLCVVVLIGAPPRRGLQFFLFLCCFCRNNPPVLFRGVRGLVRAAAGRVA